MTRSHMAREVLQKNGQQREATVAAIGDHITGTLAHRESRMRMEASRGAQLAVYTPIIARTVLGVSGMVVILG